MSTTTANMGILVPASGEADYPTTQSTGFTTIDQHDHTTGKGVQIPAGGIASNAVTTVKILDANVTRAKLAAVGQQVSASCALFATASTTLVDVTNLSISITTTGRPVVVGLIHDGDAVNGSQIYQNAVAGVPTQSDLLLSFMRGATLIANYRVAGPYFPIFPASAFNYLDAPAAGVYTYKVQIAVGPSANGTTPTANIERIKLFAYEL